LFLKLKQFKMSATKTLKMEVELSYDDLLDLIDKLSTNQKMELIESLKLKAFKENWLRLSNEIPQAGFSDAEILEEIKIVRTQRHAA
jgi:hypothetical protein